MAAPINLQANLQLNPASLNASAKQVQQALGRITGQASEFQKSLDASTARVFAFGATTAVIAGVGTAFKKLVSTTITVQEELIKVNAILGASAKDFSAFRDAIFNAAKSTGQSFQTVAAGAQELARQGLNAAETAKRLEAAMILTRISGMSAEASVKALTAAINGFTSAGLTAVDVTNKIVAVDTRFAVSADDLAQGFSRAGSTAEDAGVKFDELLGLITAVEQKTSRGGAVIGNAFKSIFTRLSRGDTIDELRALGVEIDASQTGIQKLKALSDAIENISDPTQVSAIKELAGGVYQINVVSAALKDLNSETSIFAEATKASMNAGNDAFERNAELGKSLASQINKLVVTFTSLAERIGSVTLAPLLEDMVGMATKFGDFINKALNPEESGGKFIKGLFSVIGKFLSGPALVIFGQAFLKIFAMVTRFAMDGLKSILSMGSAAEKIANVEQGIVNLLVKDQGLRQKITSTTLTQAQKEQAVIAAIKSQNSLLRQQQALVSSIAASAMRAGVTGVSGSGTFTGKKGRGFAAGFNPYRAEEMEAMSLGASSSVRAYKTNLRGHGPAIVNDQEDIINIGGKDAVIPRYPRGYVPKTYSRQDLEGLSPAQLKSALATQKFQDSSKGVQQYGQKLQRAGGYAAMQKAQAARKLPEYNFNHEYGMIVPEVGGTSVAKVFVSDGGSKGVVGTEQPGPNTVARVQVPIYRLNKSAAKAKTGSQLVDKYTRLFTDDAIKFAHQISGGELPKPRVSSEISKTLNKGSATSAAGSIFESGVASMLKDGDFADFQKRAVGSLMDFRGPSVRKLRGNNVNPFNIPNNTTGLEAKYSSKLATGAAEKIYKIQGLGQKAFKLKKSKGKAAGHIPRLAKGFLPSFPKTKTVGDTSYKRSVDKLGNVTYKAAGAVDKFGTKAMLAGMGLSMASAGLDAFAAKLEEGGNAGGALIASAGSSAAMLGSMGMMISPVVGAFAALAGAAFSLIDKFTTARDKISEENKRGKELDAHRKRTQNRIEKHRSMYSSLGFENSRDVNNVAKDMAKQHPEFRDYTKRLKELNRILNDSKTTHGNYLKAEKDLAEVTKQVAEAREKIREWEFTKIQIEKTRQAKEDRIQMAKDRIAKNERAIQEANTYADSAKSILGAMGGPRAASLAKRFDQNKDIYAINSALTNMEKARTAIEEATDEKGKKEASRALAQAGQDFKDSVIKAATNMKVQMKEMLNRSKEIQKEIDQNRFQQVQTSFGGLADTFNANKIDMNKIDTLGANIRSSKDPAFKAQAAAEMRAMMSGISPVLQDMILKKQGLSAEDMFRSQIQNIFGDSISKKEREEMVQKMMEESGGKAIDMLNEEAKILKKDMNDLSVSFANLKKNFDFEGIVTNIDKMDKSLTDATKNIGNLAQATNKVTDIATQVTNATTEMTQWAETNNRVIGSLNVRVLELERRERELKDSLR